MRQLGGYVFFALLISACARSERERECEQVTIWSNGLIEHPPVLAESATREQRAAWLRWRAESMRLQADDSIPFRDPRLRADAERHVETLRTFASALEAEAAAWEADDVGAVGAADLAQGAAMDAFSATREAAHAHCRE